VTVWRIIEPILIEVAYQYPQGLTAVITETNRSKTQESIKKIPVERREVEDEVRRLVVNEKRSVADVCALLRLGGRTVRGICRTFRIGPYAEVKAGAIRRRTSQVPFGWMPVGNGLVECPSEMKWVRYAFRRHDQGISLNGIAREFNEKRVPTKNGGTWHAKTIFQVLKFNRGAVKLKVKK
jgi:hypothetical protein